MRTTFTYSKTINIIIVDDNSLFRNVIKRILEKELSCNIIGEFSNDETLTCQKYFPQADVILMDLQMPKMTGILTASRWLEVHPKAKIIALTLSNYNNYNGLLKEIGFKGCICKNNFLDNIIPAIDCVHTGGNYFIDHFHISHINQLFYN